MEKAESARQELLEEYPDARVDLLQVDVSKPQSAITAASEIKNRCTHTHTHTYVYTHLTITVDILC